MWTKNKGPISRLRYHTRVVYSVGVVSVCLFLVSCTVEKPKPTPPAPELTTQEQIVYTADSVDQSVMSLYEIERAKKPENLIVRAGPEPEPIYPSLSRRMSVDWAGPVEPLVQEIALLTNYRLKVMGHEPAIPVLVSFNDREVTAHELLREARAQIYQRADILIFPESGVIELHYTDV